VIEVDRLAKRYPGGRGRADVVAVAGASWRAADGRITALLGANGAGKTTTLRLAAGLIAPDAGGVRIDGIDVAADPAAARARLGLLGDARGLYPRLTARENIVYFGRLHGMPTAAASARAEALARQLGLAALLDRRCEGFSQGERMKTALARALVHDPANVVLDEPTNGLDVLATRALRELLRRLRDEAGKCVVVSTHVMQEVERLADEVVVMTAGRTVAHGSVAALRAQAGEADFEAAFVRLAYGAAGGGAAPVGGAGG
jgi:sodium transport system ATP-binding protein